MTERMRREVLQQVQAYGTGSDTLRVLALATVDNPSHVETWKLEEPERFKDYEVGGEGGFGWSLGACFSGLEVVFRGCGEFVVACE